MNVKCWISFPICDSEQYPKIKPWYLQIQIKPYEVACEILQLLVFRMLSLVFMGRYYRDLVLFCKETVVYDPHYKHLHVYIKQKLNNSAREYSI